MASNTIAQLKPNQTLTFSPGKAAITKYRIQRSRFDRDLQGKGIMILISADSENSGIPPALPHVSR